MTQAEARAYLAAVDPGAIRVRAYMPLRAIAAAVGVSISAVHRWERHEQVPTGRNAQRYCRIIQDLERHLEVPEEAVSRG